MVYDCEKDDVEVHQTQQVRVTSYNGAELAAHIAFDYMRLCKPRACQNLGTACCYGSHSEVNVYL